VRFRRFSKRRQRAAILVALADRVEWGPPLKLSAPVRATQEGLCVTCGTAFDVGTSIVLARYGPPIDNRQTWIHDNCPSIWDALARTVEEYDSKIVTKINRVGRGRASGCGHDVTDQPVYLVRRPVSLEDTHSSDWFCESCTRPQ
jgi:hypothetical protein